ncbi:MAG: outer membrane beta-barrel protein [Nitrospiraceae bacterium]
MNTFSKTVGALLLGAQLITAPVIASAQDEESIRKGLWEIILSPQYMLAKNLGFDGGTTAKIEDTWGFHLQVGYNFNDHWNLAGLFSWSEPNYHALIQPAAGNPLPARNTSGSIQMNTFGMALTYNILKSPLTPYIDGMLAGTYINTDIAAGPPQVGCYWDPWYGQICGVAQPTKSDTFFTFGLGGGLRWDVNRWFFLRGGARYQWIDISNTGTPGFTLVKLDVGFKF